jgi:hypothetical protein
MATLGYACRPFDDHYKHIRYPIILNICMISD